MDILYCRICAVLKIKSQNELLNFDHDPEKWREITNKLIRINANINAYVLNKNVCSECITSLDQAYKFVIAVEQAQATFKELIASVKEEDTNIQEVKEEKLAVEVKLEVLESESYNFIYEPGALISDNNSKVIVNNVQPDTMEVPPGKCENTETIKKIKSSRKTYKFEDSIPLSELKRTWKDCNWLCMVCETQFPSLDELQEHSMQYHNCCNPYKCLDCNSRKIQLDKFIAHIQFHRKYLKLSCYKCLKTFESLKEAANHKNIHQTSKFICQGCNISFPDSNELIKHTTKFFTQHRGRYGVVQSEPCPICSETYETKQELRTHLKTHGQKLKTNICDICGKSYCNVYVLADHRKLHDDARPFQCNICGRRFKTDLLLRKHVGVHDGRKPFSCDKCGKSFRQRRQLKKHGIIHTDLMPYACSYCNKPFRSKDNLKHHILQHTGVKPYSCSECDHKFTNWPNYNKHMKMKHGKNMAKEKPVLINFN